MQMPSPPMNLATSPKDFICLSMGPPTASMPPKNTTSGFFALMLVKMGLKSVDLSLVNSLATTTAPAATTALANSSATPWP